METVDENGKPMKVARYVMKGPLFFGSAELFQSRFIHMREDPTNIVVHLDNVRVHDSSGLEALQNVAHKAEILNKKITFVISSNTKRMIDRSADFLTSFDYVVSKDNMYYVCPRNDKCRRSCRRQRLEMCSCYSKFTGTFSRMWKAIDSCHRKCCYSCCNKCKPKGKCLKCVEESYGIKKEVQKYKAHIVFEKDNAVLKKLSIDSVIPSRVIY